MFERFTRPARAAITAAVEEAELRRDRHVGTEHLLLGLARSEAPPVAATLRGAAIDIEAARAALADEEGAALAAVGIALDPHRAEPASEAASSPGDQAQRARRRRDHRPFTSGAREVLHGALAEGKAMRHRRLGAEHVLLALTARPAQNPAVRLLQRLGVDPDGLRRELTSRLRRGSPRSGP